jgi:hypothetical protein
MQLIYVTRIVPSYTSLDPSFLLFLLILLVVQVLILITEVLLTDYTRSPIINTQTIETKHTRSKQSYN